MSLWEIIMLICFGAAWPCSIYKSYHCHSTKGKSLLFMLTILLGYVAGAINKWLYNFDAVFYLYLINILFVFIDLGFYIRNSHQEKTALHCGQKILQCHS